MCLPLIALVPLAISAASTAASFAAQSQQASAQQGYENNMYAQTGRIASQNYTQTIAQTGVQGAEQATAASNNATNNEVQSAQQLGGAVTGEAAGGVMGNSVNELFHNYNRLEATNNNNIHTQLQWQQQQAGQNLLAARSGTQGQIASATPQPVAQPSALAAGLGIAGSAASAVNTGMYMNQSGPYNPYSPNGAFGSNTNAAFGNYNTNLDYSMLANNGLQVD